MNPCDQSLFPHFRILWKSVGQAKTLRCKSKSNASRPPTSRARSCEMFSKSLNAAPRRSWSLQTFDMKRNDKKWQETENGTWDCKFRIRFDVSEEEVEDQDCQRPSRNFSSLTCRFCSAVLLQRPWKPIITFWSTTSNVMWLVNDAIVCMSSCFMTFLFCSFFRPKSFSGWLDELISKVQNAASECLVKADLRGFNFGITGCSRMNSGLNMTKNPQTEETLLTLCCGRRTDLLCFISQCQVPVLFFVLNLSGHHLKQADPKDSSKPAKHRTGSSMFPCFLLFRAPKRVCHIQYKHFKSQASQDSADSWLSRCFYVAFTRRCGCLFGRPFDKAFALLGTGTSCTMGTWCKPQTLCLDGTSWYIMVYHGTVSRGQQSHVQSNARISVH